MDEAGSDNARQLTEYFHDLNGKIINSEGVARTAISCRHFPILAHSLDINVDSENNADIKKYVSHRLATEILKEDLTALTLVESQTLEETIVKLSQGVFQWARLVLPRIIDLHRGGESLNHIKEELAKVPPDLKNVYEHILKKVIDSGNRT